MKKKLIIALMCILPLGLAAQAQLKFGQLNMQEVFAIMPERTTAEKELETLSKKYEDELLKMQEEYNKKYKEFVADQETMPENIKLRRMQEVQSIEQRIMEFRHLASEELQKKQQELLAPIMKKLNDAVNAVGAEGSFTNIFDTGYPAVVFSGASCIDVTAQVKAKLGLK